MPKRRCSDDVKQVASKVMRFNNSESQKASLKVRLDRPLKRAEGHLHWLISPEPGEPGLS